MSSITTKDGATISYKDWGDGPAVVFSHGWPLSSDAFEDQMFFLASNGYRCVAHDRRGHGRSSDSWSGHDLDTYADDLATLVDALEIDCAMLVGHSIGGSEIIRYIGRHGTRRVARLVLISAIAPLGISAVAQALGPSVDGFDTLREAVLRDRSGFWTDLSLPFYGYNRPGVSASQGVRDSFWLQGMSCGLPGACFCIDAMSKADLTEDLKVIDVPTLILHGDDDQLVPIDVSARLAARLVQHSILEVISGGPHGLCATHSDRVNQSLLAFVAS